MLLQVSQYFGLDVPVYHSRYFYVMCCECGDNDGYRHRHKNAQHIFVNNLAIKFDFSTKHFSTNFVKISNTEPITQSL